MIYLYHKPQDMCFQNELHKPQVATIAFQAAQQSITPPSLILLQFTWMQRGFF